MSLHDQVRNYVHQHYRAVAAQPTWAINEPALHRLGLSVSGATSFAQNIDLKLQLADLWSRSRLRMRRRIADYYVADWGGIKRNSAARMDTYVRAAIAGEVPPLNGVASWSKVFTASNPREHAIFDARVALALNLLQLGRGRYDRMLWPALPSQNRIVKASASAVRAHGLDHSWIRLDRSSVYPEYIEVLRYAARGLPGPLPLATAEMVLFAQAPRLALAQRS